MVYREGMIYRDRYEKDLVIRESSSILGQVHGCVFVENRVNLQVHGTIVGTLIIEKGSEVFIHGTMTGNIENRGSLYIFGTVNGNIETAIGAKSKIDNKATVIGQKC